MPAVHEVYALRYATVVRRRRENFISDDHDGPMPMPMDYFVWVIRRGELTWLVDTGFDAEAATARERTLLRCPIESLGALGIDPQEVRDVLITHLHYDHAGNLNKLPGATLHLQERELQFATGSCMCHGAFRQPYSVDDIVQVVRRVHAQRVRFYDGDHTISDGIELLRIGGHTAGLQAVRVFTARGWVILASDASHFYANLHRSIPFPIVWHVGEMLDGWRRLSALCEGPDHLIPGHDPLVLQRFRSHGDSRNEVVCLHQPPISPLPDSWQ